MTDDAPPLVTLDSLNLLAARLRGRLASAYAAIADARLVLFGVQAQLERLHRAFAAVQLEQTARAAAPATAAPEVYRSPSGNVTLSRCRECGLLTSLDEEGRACPHCPNLDGTGGRCPGSALHVKTGGPLHGG